MCLQGINAWKYKERREDFMFTEALLCFTQTKLLKQTTVTKTNSAMFVLMIWLIMYLSGDLTSQPRSNNLTLPVWI